LLDYARVGALQARIGHEQIAALAKRGIDDAERLADKMAELPAGSAELTREAHNVKGTSGTLGLLRVSQVAADIEQAARSGHAVAHLRAALAEAVTATRAELQRSVFGSDQDRAP
jgi:HPt (histidine-containing phosphotransfer) domain-containing protein